MLDIHIRNRETGQFATMKARYDRIERRTIIEVFEELPLFGESTKQVVAQYRTRKSLWQKWERVPR